MGLQFLSPLYLFGLAAAAVPIIIHLMEQRQEVVVSLPTIRFVIEAHRRTARRLKIRRWLLLALRILMVTALVMIMARPVIIRSQALLSPDLPSSTIIIIDNSPSMTYEKQGQTYLDEARRLAGLMVDKIVPPGEVIILDTAGEKDGASFLRGVEEALTVIEGIKASPRKGSAASTLNNAFRRMESAANSLRQIVVLTDMTTPVWSRLKMTDIVRPDLNVPLRVIDLSGGIEGWNCSVEDMKVLTRPGREEVGLARVILNTYGERKANMSSLTLTLDGRLIGRRVVDFGQPGRQSIEFDLPPMDEGLHQLEGSIDLDHLTFDNRFYGAFVYGGKTAVLTVDGSPKASLMGSETFFLRAALTPDPTRSSERMQNTVIFSDQLTPEIIENNDVIILANVRSLEMEVAMTLSEWVNSGGGLIIFLGDNYDIETFRRSYDGGGADLSPAFFGSISEPPGEGMINILDINWPPLSVFSKPGSGDFSRSVFYRYVAAEKDLKPGTRVMMAFDERGKYPLVMERMRGKGRVILFSSSADLDWNTMPAHTVYLPLVQQIVDYLAGPRGLSQKPSFTAGERINLDLKKAPITSSIPVVTPGGKRREAIVEKGGGRTRLMLNRAVDPGFYEFHIDGKLEHVPVNIDREESNVNHLPEELLRSISKPLPLEVIHWADSGFEEKGLQGTTDTTPWFLAALLVLLLAEGFLSLGFSPKGK